MMDGIRTWLLGVVVSAFASGLACELIPKGRGKGMVRMVGGLMIVLALMRPLGSIPFSAEIDVADFSLQTEKQAEAFRAEREQELAVIIEKELEAYIWDKAIGMGINCAVHVTVSRDENGTMIPGSVKIGAEYSAELSAWLEEVVGILADKQIWLEESV